MFALKQFRHYLLGHAFKLITDHAPFLPKMEGLLVRWVLGMQEFDFTITYRKGTEHGNADALYRQCIDHNAAVGLISQNF